MSNKLAKLTPEQKQQQENERYMQGKPTRMEVANYVNALLEESICLNFRTDFPGVYGHSGYPN